MAKRRIPSEDVARFWQARAAGISITEASKIAGISYNAGQRWDAQKRKAIAEGKAIDVELAKIDRQAGSHAKGKAIADQIDDGLPPVIPDSRLPARAKKAREDFDYFRRVYLGRVPSPWQVEAAYQILEYLESPEKEFIVVNCPPGAGKSTLFHDVAVWMIVRNRGIRILYGSNTEKMAKQYSRRIRETLERPVALKPDPDLVRRGLALDAEGCLAQDFGRFRPTASGALWRAEEFIVEQMSTSGLDNKEPTVSAYGIDSEFIGHRANLCLFDDVATTENAKQGASRDKLLERWDSMAEARLEPGGALVVIGQRLGPGDLYAHCLAKFTYDDFEDSYDGSDVTEVERAEAEPAKRQKYHHIIYKAYYEELDSGPESRRVSAPGWPEGPLLDPFRLSWKDLSFIRHSNPTKFRTVYQQEDLELEQALIDRIWATGGIGTDGVEYPGCIDRHRRPGQIPQNLAPPLISVASVDPSAQNFWAVQWWLYQPDTNLRFLIDLERRRMTAEDLLGYSVGDGRYSGVMDEWQLRSNDMGYPITHWIVEINAAQRYLLAHDFVRRWQALRQVNVVPHTTSRNKLDENLGVEALLPQLWRSGSVRLPSMVENWKTLALVDEMSTWTRDKKKGTDLVMAHWFAELHLPQISPVKAPPRLWRPSWLRG